MKMDKEIIGREYLSSTRVDLDNDGTWKAVNEIHDRVLYRGETEWVDEVINAMSIDTDSQTAIQTAMSSTLNYLVQSVYQNGFKGLVEYRAYQRELDGAKKLWDQEKDTLPKEETQNDPQT